MGSFFTAIEPIKPLSFDKDGVQAASPVEGRSSMPFADVLRDAVSNYEVARIESDEDSMALTLGDVNNLAKIQINSMKAQAALSTTVQLTSRAVSAYKEIMQMQV
jgi:flagellar hook-basal body complex protein FliE